MRHPNWQIVHVNALHRSTTTDAEYREPLVDLRRRLLQQADTCVACGMCLPVCPTYTDSRNEAENARGRIALIRGLAEQRLEPAPQLLEHLDRCLQCQACERVCPAGVHYGELMDGARALLRQTRAEPPAPRVAKTLAWWMRSRPRLYLFGWLLYFYRLSGLQWLARHSGLIRILGLSPADRFADVRGIRYSWRSSYSAQGPERGRVGLFTGCVANLVDRTNLHSAIELLREQGFRVEVPRAQRCCGAMDLHAGREDLFVSAQAANLDAFAASGVDTVAYIASGCGAVLQNYGRSATKRPLRFVDINRFMVEVTDDRDFQPDRAQGERTFLHIPCSMRNATREDEAPGELLQRAGVDFVRAAPNSHCCGAAGTYSLRHPKLARKLGRSVLQQARDHGCTTLTTCNVGCAMHLQSLAEEQGTPMPVLHPVQWASKHMNRNESREH